MEGFKSTLGQPNVLSIIFFFIFIGITFVITYWAAKRSKSASQYWFFRHFCG